MEYVYVSSLQNINIFPDNTWHSFTVELPKELKFDKKCECALLYFDVYPDVQEEVDIFCDLLEQSCYKTALAPFLATATSIPFQPSYLNFVKVISPSIRRFRITIKSSFTVTTLSQSQTEARMILVFQEI